MSTLFDGAFPPGKLTPKQKAPAAKAQADLDDLQTQMAQRLKDANDLLNDPNASLAESGC